MEKLILKIVRKVKFIFSLLKPKYNKCTIIGKKSLFIKGKNNYFAKGVIVNVKYGGKITIGNNCEFHEGVIIATYGGNIKIGDNCSFNPYTIIYGHGNIEIKNMVRIAAHCVLIPGNHSFSDIHTPIMRQELSKKGIVINDDVWIGTNVCILDGVIIHKGCVVGAGSVVNKNLESFGIYAGNPVKLIKTRIIKD
jgi:acetyltransferase-like isoleucine patch superfamily enzyme